MKKNLVRVDTSTADLIDAKPPRKERPKCLQCDGTITLLKTWWYHSDLPRDNKPVRYRYLGESYFCCRNCAMAYAHKKAQEELNIPKFQ